MFTRDTLRRSGGVVFAFALVVLLPTGAAAQQSANGKADRCNDVSRLTINPVNVVGGTSSIGQVGLKQAAKANGLTVQLSSENPSAVTVPSQIIVTAGATVVDFNIQTMPVATDTHVFVYAHCGNDQTNSRQYQISVRAPRLLAIELTKALRPGENAYGKVILNGPAPSEGLTVQLQKGAYLAVPDSVLVPPGQTEALFEVRAENLTGKRTGGFTGRAGGSIIPASTSVDPAAPPPTMPTLTAPRVVSTPTLTPKVPVTTAPAAQVDPGLAAASATSATSVTAGSSAQTMSPMSPPDPKAAAQSGAALTSPTAVASGTASGDPCNPPATIAPFRSTDPISLAATAPTSPPGSTTMALSVNPTSASAVSSPTPSTLAAQQVLTNPGHFTAQAPAPANVRLAWDPVDGVRCYSLEGPGIAQPSRKISTTEFYVTDVPAGTAQYRLWSHAEGGAPVDPDHPAIATVTVLPGPVLVWSAIGMQPVPTAGTTVRWYWPHEFEYDQGGVHYAYVDPCCSRSKRDLVSAWKMTPVRLDGTNSVGAIKSCRFDARGPDGFIWSAEVPVGVIQTSQCFDRCEPSPQGGNAIACSKECTDRTIESRCQADTELPADKDTEVLLTVTYNGGEAATAKVVAYPHDFLIVALGDSYGSGEGTFSYEGSNRRCDRSILSAQAQVALDLEQSDPHTSVTFIHLACSGAKIEDPTDPKSGGLVDRYEGVHPTGGVLLLPQVEAAKRLLDQDNDGRVDRPIDALLISIGGNDAYFGDIVVNCGALPIAAAIAAGVTFAFVGGVMVPVSAAAIGAGTLLLLDLPFPCSSDLPGSGAQLFKQGLAQLPGRFDHLRSELQVKLGLDTTLAPDRVYLWEYPIATKNERGQYCNGLDVRFGKNWPGGGQGILAGFSSAEFEWADAILGPNLNATIRSLAASYQWSYIGRTDTKEGIADAFKHHGLCADDSWLVRPVESIASQGDEKGTFHPTTKGYRVMADKIGERVIPEVRQRTGL